MRINFNLKNNFKHICLSAISCVDMNMFVYMRLPYSSKNVEKGLCYADKQIFSKLKCSVTLQSAGSRIQSCWLLWHWYIRGDPHCVLLSLEGLSKATTCKPHRICSTWRTCESALTKYAHAKELTDFDGLQDRGACFSPRLTKNGSVHMWLGWRHAPSSPSSWGCCHDQFCWIMKSIMALWVSACRTKVPFTR